MDYESVLSVGVAVCLLFALGASANALESAVSTDPDDVIDIDYASLPLSPDETGELKDAVTGESSETTQAPQRNAEGDPTGEVSNRGTSGGEDQFTAEQGPPKHIAGGGGDNGDRSGASTAQDPGNQQQQTQTQGVGPGEKKESLLDRLLSLLQQLLPFVLLLAVLAALYALRHRIADALGTDDVEDQGTEPDVTYVAEPGDEVSEAWYEMVRTLGLDQDISKTPRECVRAAEQAGVNPSIARSLTDLYEQIRYAGEPITDDRVRRARDKLQQFRQQYGGATGR